ncbi:MAG: SHOCT domain-containing protein [Thermoleophilia bacterium]
MDWSFWDVLWTTFVVFLWISVLVIYINVVIDVFRSKDLSGWGKTGWLILLLVLPLIGVLIYVIARGPGMGERAVRDQLDRADAIRAARGEAGGGDATDQIARAKELLDSGAIDQTEYEQLKSRALAG